MKILLSWHKFSRCLPSWRLCLRLCLKNLIELFGTILFSSLTTKQMLILLNLEKNIINYLLDFVLLCGTVKCYKLTLIFRTWTSIRYDNDDDESITKQQKKKAETRRLLRLEWNPFTISRTTLNKSQLERFCFVFCFVCFSSSSKKFQFLTQVTEESNKRKFC